MFPPKLQFPPKIHPPKFRFAPESRSSRAAQSPHIASHRRRRPQLSTRASRALTGALVLAVVGGGIAWTAVDKTVTVKVDGVGQRMHTIAGTAGGILSDAGYSVGAHDLIAPAADTAVGDGGTVVLRRGRLLHLDIDGTRRDVWTTATTVDEALAQLGYAPTDATSVSRSTRLPLTPTGIDIRAPKSVTVVHDGRTDAVMSTAPSVEALLGDLGLTVGETDRLSAPLSSPLTDHEQIVLTRVSTQRQTVNEQVPFPVQQSNDPGIPSGQTVVLQPGAVGVDSVTYDVVYVDGKPVGRTQVARTTVTAPAPRVVHVGTGAPPPDDVANNQAIARAMLAQFGFGQDQMSCLITMWNHESGWRATAENPNGGAYGIPQSLPGDKMATAGANWRTDPRVQIAWGLGYIKRSYGTPCGAWSSWQAHGGWY